MLNYSEESFEAMSMSVSEEAEKCKISSSLVVKSELRVG